MCRRYVKGFVLGFSVYAKSAGVMLPECDALLMRPLEPEGDEKVNAAYICLRSGVEKARFSEISSDIARMRELVEVDENSA